MDIAAFKSGSVAANANNRVYDIATSPLNAREYCADAQPTGDRY
jgi:hypothetical protein